MPVKGFVLLVVYLVLYPVTSPKKTIWQQIASVAWLIRWMGICLKEGRKQKLWKQISWRKSEKFKSTINFSVYIFLCRRRKKIKNKIKVHDVHKIYHYNEIDVEVNFEAQSSFVYFSFLFLYWKEKKTERKAKHFSQNLM